MKGREPSSGRRQKLLVLLLSFVLLVLAVGVTPASAVAAPTVSTCTTISDVDVPADGIVRLNSSVTDATGTCIIIEASDFVFDGMGHTVDGVDGTGSVGIHVNGSAGATNVTVRNLTVRDWNEGVLAEATSDVLVTDVVAASNYVGISFVTAVDSEIRGVTTVDNNIAETSQNIGRGINLDYSSDRTTITDIKSDNDTTALYVRYSANVSVTNSEIVGTGVTSKALFFDGSPDGLVQNVTLTGKISGGGFDVVGGSDGTVVRDNYLRAVSQSENSISYIQVGDSDDVVVEGNDASEANLNGDGLALYVVDNLTARDNTFDGNSNGIFARDIYNSSFENNSISGNDNPGLYLFSGAGDNVFVGNEFLNNGVQYSTNHGVYIDGSSSSVDSITFRNNDVSGSTESGFWIFDATNTTVVGNTIRNNGDYGLRLYRTGDTLLRDNIISGNGAVGVSLADATGGEIYNNRFNNTDNVETTSGASATWNVARTTGPNIVGGPELGGNYYARPAGDGFSETCADTNADGFCDSEYNHSAGNVDTLPLVVGTAAPIVTVSPDSLAFGDVPRDGTATLSVTVGNNGNATLSVDSAALGGSDAQFSITSEPAATIDPGNTTTVAVTFAPTTTGSTSETLTLTTSDPDTPTVAVAVTATGTASETKGTLNVTVKNGTASPLDSVVVDIVHNGSVAEQLLTDATGQASTRLPGGRTYTVSAAALGYYANSTTVNVVNGTTADVGLVLRADDTPPVAALTANTTNLTTAEAVRLDASGSTDDVGVVSTDWTLGDGATATGQTAVHTYASPGTYTVTVTVADAAGNTNATTETIAVTRAPEPDIDLTPTSVDFGDVTVGATPTATVTVANVGNATLTVTAIDITGESAGLFGLAAAPSVPFDIAPGANRPVTVEYGPTAPAAVSVDLEVGSNDPDEATVTATLAGTGVRATTESPRTPTPDYDDSNDEATETPDVDDNTDDTPEASSPLRAHGPLTDGRVTFVFGGGTGVEEVYLNISGGEGDVEVRHLSELPPEVPATTGRLMQLLEVSAPDPVNGTATIRFTLNGSATETFTGDVERLVVEHYLNGSWETLETTVTVRNSTVVVEAVTDGFSPFAITESTTTTETPITETPETATPTTTVTTTPVTEPPGEPAEQESEATAPSQDTGTETAGAGPGFEPLLTVVALVSGLALLVYRNRAANDD